VDFAARLVEILLEIFSFAFVEAAAGLPVDPLLGAHRRFVGLQLVQFTLRELAIFLPVSDPRLLPSFPRIHAHARMVGIRGTGRVLRSQCGCC